ncbi:8900_t:CDS:2, partial [Gigaspora margarita]
DTPIEFIINNSNDESIFTKSNTSIYSVSSTHSSQINMLSKGSRQFSFEITNMLLIGENEKTTQAQIRNMKSVAQEKSLSGKTEINTSFLKPYKNTIQSEKKLDRK